MFLRDVVASAVRRWPIALLLLALTGGLMLYASTVVKPTYETKASLVLIPPADPAQREQNRYLGLGGLQQSADVLANSVMSEATAKKLEETVAGATYEVSPDWSTSAPILAVATASPTAAGAQQMLEATLAEIPRTLIGLQESIGVKPENQITLIEVSRNIAAAPVEKARIRTLGMLGVFLLGLCALLVAGIDGILLRRAARAAATGDEEDDDAPVDDPPVVLGPAKGQTLEAPVAQGAEETTGTGRRQRSVARR